MVFQSHRSLEIVSIRMLLKANSGKWSAERGEEIYRGDMARDFLIANQRTTHGTHEMLFFSFMSVEADLMVNNEIK